jgi:serine/threonine protein kinase
MNFYARLSPAHRLKMTPMANISPRRLAAPAPQQTSRPQPVVPAETVAPKALGAAIPPDDRLQNGERRGREVGQVPAGMPAAPLRPPAAGTSSPKPVAGATTALETPFAAASLAGTAVASGDQPSLSLAARLAARPYQWQQACATSRVKTCKFLSPTEVYNGKGGKDRIKASMLQGTQDTYYISQTMRVGGYGKIRYGRCGRDIRDQIDRRLAVKVVHIASKKDAFGTDLPMQTKVTHPRALSRETAILGHLGLLREVIQHDSKVYLVLDFAQGDARELKALLWVKNQASLLRTVYAAHLLVELTRSLAAIHAKGVAHRDVKLENFLYDATGKLTPTDFGLSDFTEDAAGTIPTAASGTRAFMAPEVVRAGSDASVVQTLGVDTWAAAMATVQAWTGQHNPLARCKEPQDLANRVDALLNWRQQLVVAVTEPSDPNLPDTLNLRRIGTLGGDWDSYFAAMGREAPALLDLLLTHMLQPDPTRRVSMQQALDLARGLKAQLPAHTVASLERVWCNAAARMSPQKKAVFDALDDFGRVLEDHLQVKA